MTPILKDLLLAENPNVLNLASYLNRCAMLFVLPTFYIGIIVEYFSTWDFKGVIQRTIIAVIAIQLLAPMHMSVAKEGITVASDLIIKYSPHNRFLSAFDTFKTDKKNKGWAIFTKIVEMITVDSLSLVIFILSYIAFFLLTQFYSLVYHLGAALFGLCAVLSILPITKQSLIGAIKTSLWCLIMPFVVAIVLCLVGDSESFVATLSGGIVQNLESLLQLLILTILLLMTPFITGKIMSVTGISTVAENLGQMAAMTTLMTATKGLSLVGEAFKAKAMGGVSKVATPLVNRFKDHVGDKADQIRDQKFLGPTASELAETKITENLKNMYKQGSRDFSKTTISEKTALAFDNVVNRKENAVARGLRKEEVKNNGSSSTEKEKILSLSSYKADARKVTASMVSEKRKGNPPKDYSVYWSNSYDTNTNHLKVADGGVYNGSHFIHKSDLPNIKKDKAGVWRDRNGWGYTSAHVNAAKELNKGAKRPKTAQKSQNNIKSKNP